MGEEYMVDMEDDATTKVVRVRRSERHDRH